MSSKPSTPVTQRRFQESEFSRIPVSLSPIPFRRTHSMRLRTNGNGLLNETTLKQHNRNFVQTRNNFERNHQQLKLNLWNNRRGSLTMDAKSDSNGIDSGGTDEIDHSPNNNLKQVNGNLRQSSSNKNDRGMTLNLNSPLGFQQRSPRTPQTPKTPNGIHYVKNTHSPKTPPVTPDRYADDDLDSLHSYSSMASSNCEHPYFARNGTTFSGRKMKYVVHCSNYAGQAGDEYLTPTQRAQKHLRRLKELLAAARVDLEQKDSEILRLTKEVVELRLFKASLSSPEECSKSSDCNSVPTVRENTTNDLHTPASEIASPMIEMVEDGFKSSPRHTMSANRTPLHHAVHAVQFIDKLGNSEMQSSFADSGHFEDITTSSIHSKDSFANTQDRASGSEDVDQVDPERQRLVQMYEEKIEELIKQHDGELNEEKRCNNNRVEALLERLAVANSRYCDLMPDYEQAKERIRELEREVESLQEKLGEQEDKTNKMYLHMYAKEQEAVASTSRASMESLPGPSRISVPELMHQLQVTQNELENIRDERYTQATGNQSMLSAKEAISLWLLGARKTMYKRMVDAHEMKPSRVDPEITLQFLKSAIYYFLTDKENSQGHLKAIESILGFTEKEKENIDKARNS
ncbi:CLUMA_CG015845, isoform B [Clunio marinus]|uniref:CLUMA_CG015845, isoform B n=1 Tax=Clunio marinus TaxID=568069 RepID=A0A1J1ISP3_9DIPT|nr:CLUMA_CG015845, isoform B [Clunio marinus]